MICMLSGFAGTVLGQQDDAPAPSEYTVGVEDRLAISVWNEPELERTVIVRPDGKITYPLVGDIAAAGRTTRQLTNDITEVLARYIKEPVVTVIVEEINSFKVYVLGEVTTQGELQLKKRTRLLEALALAGGLTSFADRSNIVLLRTEGNRDTTTRIDYRRVVKGEDPALNIYLKPGDTIIVN
jgi:polysaccharide export outer membrane protein